MSKRDAIIRATVELVAENGFADTPTIQIARKAGSAENTIFRLFGNKTNLMHTTFDVVLVRFQEKCWPIIENEKDTELSVSRLMEQLFDYYRKQPEELAYILQYVNSSIGVTRRPDIRYELGEDMSSYPFIMLLAEGKEKGIFKDLSMPALVSLAILPLLVYLREEQIRNVKHNQKNCKLLISACLQGIKT